MNYYLQYWRVPCFQSALSSYKLTTSSKVRTCKFTQFILFVENWGSVTKKGVVVSSTVHRAQITTKPMDLSPTSRVQNDNNIMVSALLPLVAAIFAAGAISGHPSASMHNLGLLEALKPSILINVKKVLCHIIFPAPLKLRDFCVRK